MNITEVKLVGGGVPFPCCNRLSQAIYATHSRGNTSQRPEHSRDMLPLRIKKNDGFHRRFRWPEPPQFVLDSFTPAVSATSPEVHEQRTSGALHKPQMR